MSPLGRLTFLSLMLSLGFNGIATALTASLANGVTVVESKASTAVALAIYGQTLTLVYWGLILFVYGLIGSLFWPRSQRPRLFQTALFGLVILFIDFFFVTSTFLDAAGDASYLFLGFNPIPLLFIQVGALAISILFTALVFRNIGKKLVGSRPRPETP